MLRRLGIRPRPFYNTRHTHISYAISLGTKLATVCAQTGTSPAMIEKHYGRYMPQAGDFDLIEAALGGGRKVKPNVKPSDLAEPALSEALLHRRRRVGFPVESFSPDAGHRPRRRRAASERIRCMVLVSWSE